MQEHYKKGDPGVPYESNKIVKKPYKKADQKIRLGSNKSSKKSYILKFLIFSLAIAAVVVVVKKISEVLERDKKEASMHFGEYWDQQITKENRRAFNAFREWYMNSNDGLVEKSIWLRVICLGRHATSDGLPKAYPKEITKMASTLGYLKKDDDVISLDEFEELRVNLVEILNIMEHIVVAYESGVADKRMLEDSFKESIVYYYSILQDFAKEFRKHESSQWQILTKKYNEWKEEEKHIN